MCDICSSELLGELNKKRNWRPDRVIKWAGRRGLSITADDLATHFKKHVEPISKKQNKQENAGEKSPKSICQDASSLNPDTGTGAKQISIESISQSDNQFLDEVVKRVYAELTGGKFDLKLEHGFKAIEIRQKLDDKSDTERLLLELLNEIRVQELR